VLILADNASRPHAAASSDVTRALSDADGIFAYKLVKRLNPRAQVVVEIVDHCNIGYMESNVALNAGYNYKFRPQYAGGAYFITTLLDSLVSQAYYSPEIIKLTNLLVTGVDHSAHHRRVAARRRAVYLKAVSTATNREGLHINSISDNEDAIVGSSLYQISLPAEFDQKPYGTLMEYLTSKNILPLGLLRGGDRDGQGCQEDFMPFVFTNPDKDTKLHLCDRVFCLSLQREEVAETIQVKDWVIEKQHQAIATQEFSGVVDVMKSVHETNKPVELDGPALERMKLVEALSFIQRDLDCKFSDLTAKLTSIKRQQHRRTPRQSVSFDDTVEYFDHADFPQHYSRAVSGSVDTEVLHLTPPPESDSDDDNDRCAVFDEQLFLQHEPHHPQRRRLFASDTDTCIG